MLDDKLPSQFQIGDRVAVFQNGTVTGVTFEEGKVRYIVSVEEPTFDGQVDSFNRYANSEEVTAEITQRVVNN